ncbi:PAS domain S-box protein [Methanoregula sp.]|uniref:PAS domain S-box protein n=1 Tax=Methanoregula sp. TaxID=2052170 RepID=UPI003BB1A939
MNRYVALGRYSFSKTNLIRFWIIVSLVFSSTLITLLAFSRNINTIFPQLFYFPILYGTYYYRKSGILIGGTCAVAFQTIAYYYLYPDITSLGFATAQAILFVCVSVIVAYFLDMMDTIEQRYKSIFWDSRFGVVLFDPYTFKISLANKQMEYMLGYSSTELVNMTYTQLFQSREEQNRFFERLGSGEDTVDFETRFVTKNHEPLWVSLSWNRVDPHIISCLVIDIDSRKHTIAAADDRLVQYEQITEISPLGIVILQNNVITYANRAFCAFSEYNADFIVGKKFITLIYPDDREKFMEFATRLQTRIPLPEMGEFRFFSQSDEIKRANVFFTPIEQKGKPALLIHLVNITKVNYSIFSVPELIKTIIDEGDFTAKADISLEIPPDITFDADEKKIAFVIDTLLSNAVKFSHSPRKIWISYSSGEGDPLHHISIRDNGIGITAAKLDEIFTPLEIDNPVKTNQKYGSVGLSLPVSKNYIQMHGGYINVDSTVNVGTVFIINIPKKRPA